MSAIEVQDVSPTHISLVGMQRRRSSLFNPSKPLDPGISWKKTEERNWAVVHSDGSETVLSHKKQEIVSVKNFNLELRGLQDVESLIEKTIVLLDPQSNSVFGVVQEALETICQRVQRMESRSFIDEVNNELFAKSEGQIFANSLQGFTTSYPGSSCYEPSWVGTFCSSSQLRKRLVVITRLKEPTNFGNSFEEVRFFLLILCPSKDKGTKSGLETCRTFGTLFSDSHLRQTLLHIHNDEVFKNALAEWATKLEGVCEDSSLGQSSGKGRTPSRSGEWRPFAGIIEDLWRRIPHYISDYTDGLNEARSIQKTISTSAFLYFACLLPTIAFATLNDITTNGEIDVRKGIFAQAVGHLVFALIGGQHLNILLTTAPLCLFVKIIHGLAEYFMIVDKFAAFYCCVGLWCSLFLLLSAVFNLSKIMKWCTRSTEEIFALFISVAFVVYAIKDVSHDFQQNYNSHLCDLRNVDVVLKNTTGPINLMINDYDTNGVNGASCHRETSLLFLLLMLGTTWFGLMLYNFKNTPFLQASKRELLSDYSLPAAVILFSFVGSFLFRDIQVDSFKYVDTKPLLQLAQIQTLPVSVILCSAVLGFSLCVLIFMDQNIGAAIVNNPANKLTKGPAYHWDLVVISFINVFCSLFTLPWLHVALPHAPMHVKSLADYEERVENGVVYQNVVRVRETRLTGIISHILMGLSLLLLPYPLAYIPRSVFDGLYLYMGITALGGNQMFERILLIFTEQTAYPPNHYIRRVPQRKIHIFTGLQVLLLLLLCVLGFFPYPFVKVLFPLVLLLLLFMRHKVFPKIIDIKYLDVLDPTEHQ